MLPLAPSEIRNAFDVETAILDKVYTTSKLKFNQAQMDSAEHMYKYSFGKVIEINKISMARIGNQIVFFHLDKFMIEKPFVTEVNGIRHPVGVPEALTRAVPYNASYQFGLSIWVFSKEDPRNKDKRLELIHQYKNNLRHRCKARRIRIEQVEQFGRLHLTEMERNHADGVMEDGEFDEEKQLKEMSDEDFCRLYDEQDPRYQKKLQDAYAQARIAPYEKAEFPHFITHLCFPKHLLIEIPVMLDSSLCHKSDDINSILNDVYTGGGSFIFKEHMRPFMRSTFSRFSYNMMLETDGDVENRSEHPPSALRNSSSTIKCMIARPSRKKYESLLWGIPYCKIKFPISVLFYACGFLSKDAIRNLIEFEAAHYFRNEREIPSTEDLLKQSLAHEDRGSDLIQTQEAAWLFLGKLSEETKESEFVYDLIATPEEEKEAPKIAKRKRKFLTLDAISKANDPDLQAARLQAELAGRPISTETLPIFKPYIPKDPNKEFIRKGRNLVCKEILPHLGSDIRHDSDYWKPKALYLASMVAKRLLARAALQTSNPEQFMQKDDRDLIENTKHRMNADWIINPLVKPIISSHITIGRLELIAAMHCKNTPDPKTSLDHTRPTDQVSKAFGTGIYKVKTMASHIKGGKSFQAPDANQRPSTQNNSAANKQAKDVTGITQNQNNTNLLATYSQQMRTNGNVQMQKSARLIKDHYGIKDPVETPDNKACGTVTPHTLFSEVSAENMNDDIVRELVLSLCPLISEEEVADNPAIYRDREREGNFRYVKVTVNEAPIGRATPGQVKAIADFLRAHRFAIAGNSYLSISEPREKLELRIFCDGKRACRPLFNAKKIVEFLSPISKTDRRPLWQALTWHMMVEEGFVDYIDKLEENHNCYVGHNLNDLIKLFRQVAQSDWVNIPFTHIEMKAVLLLAMCSSGVPFGNFNQGPRWIYASAMWKQAMATLFLNNATRIDTTMHQLCNSTRPLVFTVPLNWMRADEMTPGVTADVAVLCHRGYDIEDAMTLSRAWIDRGWGKSVERCTFTQNEKRQGPYSNGEFFMRGTVDNTLKRKAQNYSHVDEDGVCFENSHLTVDDIMLSRVQPIKDGHFGGAMIEELAEKGASTFKYIDCSAITLKKNQGTVTRVILTSNLDAARKVRVITEDVCYAEKGNKYSSRHAQKCLLGNEEYSEHMPFSVQTGRTPGILFNPHGKISRMTVGDVLEPLAGEISTTILQRINATPWDLSLKQALAAYQKAEVIGKEDHEFLRNVGANCHGNFDLATIDDEDNRILELCNVLKHHGLNPYAEEDFINPLSGRVMGSQGCAGRRAGKIFRGKLFYFILPHLAKDKWHARATGPRHSYTLQPTQGSAKDGGLKFGEMERDILIVDGAAALLRERHMIVSDGLTLHFCSFCGNSCESNFRDQYFYCWKCKRSESCGQTKQSNGFKLLMNALRSSGLFPRYLFSSTILRAENEK